jgi:hypothetical protein
VCKTLHKLFRNSVNSSTQDDSHSPFTEMEAELHWIELSVGPACFNARTFK